MQRCIDHALENNLSIKQAQLSSALSSEDLLQSRLSLLPSLNGSANQNYNFGRSVDPLTYQFVTQRIETSNFGLSANMTLFAGFQRLNTIRQNKYLLLANASALEKTKNDITLSVITYYLQALFAQELLKVSESQLGLSKEQVARAEKNVAVGAITDGDLLSIRAQQAQDETNLANAKNNVEMAVLNLKQLLDLKAEDRFAIVAPGGIEPANEKVRDPHEVFLQAKDIQPDISLANSRLQAARMGLLIARGSMSPRLTIGGNVNTGYSSGRQRVVSSSSQKIPVFITGTDTLFQTITIPKVERTPFSDQLNDNLSQSIGFTLQVPLFNGWQTRSSIKRAKINYQKEELNLKLSENNLEKTITQASTDASAARRKYEAATQSVEYLQKAFNYTEQKYVVGLISSIEYGTAKNNLARAQSDLLQAKYDCIFKQKVIDFYLGNPITF